MRLEILKGFISDFRNYFGTEEEYNERWIYQLQAKSPSSWSLNEEEIRDSYHKLLRSDVSKRYWKQSTYEPRRTMLLFLEMEPTLCGHAFHDLFNESKDLEGRIDRFQFYAEELLKLYREKNPLKVENNHYQDHRVISLYLSLRYPENYCYYEHGRFLSFMKKLGAKNPPEISDPVRYWKTSKIWMNFLQKDDEIMRLQQERGSGLEIFAKSRWIVYEFVRFSTTEIEH